MYHIFLFDYPFCKNKHLFATKKLFLTLNVTFFLLHWLMPLSQVSCRFLRGCFLSLRWSTASVSNVILPVFFSSVCVFNIRHAFSCHSKLFLFTVIFHKVYRSPAKQFHDLKGVFCFWNYLGQCQLFYVLLYVVLMKDIKL